MLIPYKTWDQLFHKARTALFSYWQNGMMGGLFVYLFIIFVVVAAACL